MNIKRFFKSEFVINVTTLMTGTTIAQAIPIAVTPILTRLYTPDDFGVLALFSAITAVLGVIACGKYEMAIMLPKKEEEAINIVYLSSFVAFFFSLFLFIVIFIFNSQITELLGEPKISFWLYFAPVSVLFIGLFNALNLYNSRHKNFKSISVSLVSKSSSAAIIQVGLGIFIIGNLGLIVGQITSFISGNLVLLKRLRKNSSVKKTYNRQIIRRVAKDYNRFPKFTLPANLMNSLTLNSISFVIPSLFNTGILGFFSLANRLLGVPSRVIGNSIGQVYFQKLSEIKSKDGDVMRVFLMALKRLTLLSIPIFVLAFFLVEPLFVFVFGEAWREAGVYAMIITPLSGIRFVSSSLSSTLHVFQKQNFTLYIQTLQFISIIIIFSMVYLLGLSFYYFLIIYSAVYSVEYLAFIYVYLTVIKKN